MNELETKIKLEALITYRQGMIAENEYRSQCGKAQAYGEEAFSTLAKEIRELLDSLPKEGRE